MFMLQSLLMAPRPEGSHYTMPWTITLTD